VEKIIVHPAYDESTIDYDFTLIKLAIPAELNDHVAPACFPSEDDDLVTSFPPGKVRQISQLQQITTCSSMLPRRGWLHFQLER
jgi:hypothetical protein